MSELVRTLKDGYWDLTTVVRSSDGTLRVRKESKPTESPGPWAHAALRNEIAYLKSFRDNERAPFPTLLASWDEETIGYEIPYCEDRSDFATLLLAGKVDQDAADEMQDQLGVAIFEVLHRSALLQDDQFTAHIRQVIHESIEALASHDRFRPLIDAPTLSINDQPYPGLAASCTLLGQRNLFERLEATPVVLLHGDLILENILWSPLLLIDPVSVAGLTSGHPLFDLVKYESYASGELFAIREEIVTAEPRGAGFLFEIDWGNAQLAPFRPFDLRSRFRAGYERRHGEIDRALYALLDGYFSLVMARNTTGAHQWARVIKGCQCLATAAGEVEEPVTDP